MKPVSPGRHFIPDPELDQQIYSLYNSMIEMPEEAVKYMNQMLPKGERIPIEEEGQSG